MDSHKINVVLDVSNAVDVDFIKWYNNIDEEQRLHRLREVLMIGHYVVKNGIGQYYNVCACTQDAHQELISKLSQENQTMKEYYTHMFETRYNDIISGYEQRIKHYNEQLKSLETCVMNARDEARREKDDEYKEHIQWLHDKLDEKTKEMLSIVSNRERDILTERHSEHVTNLESHIVSLRTQLDVFKSTNRYKGEIGEEMLRDFMRRNFPKCEVKDMSGFGGMSDIHVIDEYGQIVVIESKNKANIALTDVDKSIRDIELLRSRLGSQFAGYIFVSLRSTNIPRKGDICFEVISDVPTFWYGASEGENMEQNFVKLVKILFCHGKIKKSVKVDEERVVAMLNSYINMMKANKKTLVSLLDSNKQNRVMLESLQSSNDNMFVQICDFLSQEIPSSSTMVMSHQCFSCKRIFNTERGLKQHKCKQTL
jgi:hypothetical protein